MILVVVHTREERASGREKKKRAAVVQSFGEEFRESFFGEFFMAILDNYIVSYLDS